MTDNQIECTRVKDLIECYACVSELYTIVTSLRQHITDINISVQFLLKKNAEIGTYTFEEDAEPADEMGVSEES